LHYFFNILVKGLHRRVLSLLLCMKYLLALVLLFQSCLLVFFNDGSSQERALKFIDEMKRNHVSSCIRHPKCILMVIVCLVLFLTFFDDGSS